MSKEKLPDVQDCAPTDAPPKITFVPISQFPEILKSGRPELTLKGEGFVTTGCVGATVSRFQRTNTCGETKPSRSRV